MSARQITGTLSKGYRQRVGLADALLTSPPVLILDEPTAGLDPTQIRSTRELIRELGQEHTILLSTHILSEVEMTCDSVIIINRGRVAASNTLAELHRQAGEQASLLAVFDGPVHADALRGLPGVTSIQPDGPSRLRLGGRDMTVLAPSLCALAVEKGWHLRELRRSSLPSKICSCGLRSSLPDVVPITALPPENACAKYVVVPELPYACDSQPDAP